MMKLLAVAFLIFSLAASLLGQKTAKGLETPIKLVKPNFSGSWILDLSKSQFDKNVESEITAVPWHFLVEHKDPTFSVIITGAGDPGLSSSEVKLHKDKAAAHFVWRTDGKGNEPNDTFEYSVSMTQWERGKLITRHYDERSRRNIVQFEEIEMAPGGDAIIMRVTSYRFLGPERSEKNIGYTEVNTIYLNRVR